MPALTRCREDAGLTQREVAARMGCHPCTVAHMESSFDDSVSLAKVRRYARAVGRDISVRITESAPADGAVR